MCHGVLKMGGFGKLIAGLLLYHWISLPGDELSWFQVLVKEMTTNNSINGISPRLPATRFQLKLRQSVLLRMGRILLRQEIGELL